MMPRNSAFLRFIFGFFLLISRPAWAAGPLDGSRQIIIAIAPTWDDSAGKLQLFTQKNGRWESSSPVFPVLFGKNGLAWGRGLVGQEQPGLHKKERDRRSPAGIFQIGRIYTYDPSLPTGADYPFHTVGPLDAWVDDPALPEYNRFLTIDPKNPPQWFARQRMKRNDFAYRWLVEIRHNADPPVAGDGSAIFFHIRRGPSTPTSGCTSLAEKNLVSLICWLRAADNPRYILLTRGEYLKHWQTWSLPAPEVAPLI